MSPKSDLEDLLHPEEGLNPFSMLMVGWIWPLIVTASERPLMESDVWNPPRDLSVKTSTTRIQVAWEAEREGCRISSAAGKFRSPTLGWAIWNGFKGILGYAYFWQVLFCLGQLGQPYLIGELVEYINSGKGGLSYGIGIAFAMSGASLVCSVLFCAFIFNLRRQAVAIRNGLIMACYEQTLNLTAASRATITVGISAITQ